MHVTRATVCVGESHASGHVAGGTLTETTVFITLPSSSSKLLFQVVIVLVGLFVSSMLLDCVSSKIGCAVLCQFCFAVQYNCQLCCVCFGDPCSLISIKALQLQLLQSHREDRK